MLQLTPHMRIIVALSHVDFRCGIDGLAALCRKLFNEDSKSGTVFVFRNRKGTAVKVLVYDSTGFWLCHKRLSSGSFSWPSTRGSKESLKLGARELLVLLWNGNPDGVFAEPWQRIDGGTEERGTKGRGRSDQGRGRWTQSENPGQQP